MDDGHIGVDKKRQRSYLFIHLGHHRWVHISPGFAYFAGEIPQHRQGNTPPKIRHAPRLENGVAQMSPWDRVSTKGWADAVYVGFGL